MPYTIYDGEVWPNGNRSSLADSAYGTDLAETLPPISPQPDILDTLIGQQIVNSQESNSRSRFMVSAMYPRYHPLTP